MMIGDRLKKLRDDLELSQGDVEKRTGLLRCYVSRLENGHTVPALRTLEKLARALGVPLYQCFYDGARPPKLPNFLKRKTADRVTFGSSGRDAAYLRKLRKCLSKAAESDRRLIMAMVQQMANGGKRRAQVKRK